MDTADRKRPPLGVTPRWLWEEMYPTPTQGEEIHRVVAVEAGVDRYRRSGLAPNSAWLIELDGVYGSTSF